MLGFKVAAANDLTKFNLVDQVIDEFEDASGIDAGASTNELVSGGAVTGAGTQSVTPTCTGGSVATDGDYKVHTITSDTNYVRNWTKAYSDDYSKIYSKDYHVEWSKNW